MRRLLALLLALVAFLVASCATARAPEVQVRTLVLSITGMTCAVDCPPRVEAALESVAGVESASVDYDARTATVRMAAGADPAALTLAVQRQGFGAVLR